MIQGRLTETPSQETLVDPAHFFSLSAESEFAGLRLGLAPAAAKPGGAEVPARASLLHRWEVGQTLYLEGSVRITLGMPERPPYMD